MDKIVFKWKSEDIIEGYLEEKLLVILRMDDIPYEHCFRNNNLHLYDGQGTASVVSKDELLEQLSEYFSENSSKNLSHLWEWIMLENFTAWFDPCDDLPNYEFVEEKEKSIPLEEDIVIIGKMENGHEVYVRKNDSGLIPHVHIRYKDEYGNDIDSAFQLNANAYYCHDEGQRIIPKKDEELFWRFMDGDKESVSLSSSNYSKAIQAWNENNHHYKTSEEFLLTKPYIAIPNYNDMMIYSPFEIDDIISQIPKDVSEKICVLIPHHSIANRKAARQIYEKFDETLIVEDCVINRVKEEVIALFNDGYASSFLKYYKDNRSEAFGRLYKYMDAMPGNDFDLRYIKDDTMRSLIHKIIATNNQYNNYHKEIDHRHIIVLDDCSSEWPKPEQTVTMIQQTYITLSINVVKVK